MDPDETLLGRWWAVVDGDVDVDPADLLADDLLWSITFDGTTRGGGRDELLAYVRDRVSAGRRHRIETAARSGATELVAGELLEHGRRLATFVAAAEGDERGALRRYLAVASLVVDLSLGRPGAP